MGEIAECQQPSCLQDCEEQKTWPLETPRETVGRALLRIGLVTFELWVIDPRPERRLPSMLR